jgi:hypothetical protein
MRSLNERSTSAGREGASAPVRFALVAVKGTPQARQSSRAIVCAGTRTPTVPSVLATPAASVAGALMSSVSGPGQNADARLCA